MNGSVKKEIVITLQITPKELQVLSDAVGNWTKENWNASEPYADYEKDGVKELYKQLHNLELKLEVT